MRTALAFDTLAYARRLKQAGVDEAQAEAVRDAGADRLKDEFGAMFTRLETRGAPAILGSVSAPFAALKLFGGA